MKKVPVIVILFSWVLTAVMILIDYNRITSTFPIHNLPVDKRTANLAF